MENNVLNVILWGMKVGKLYWNTQLSNSVFTFNKDFIAKELDISPIQASINNSMMAKGFPINGNKDKPYSGLPEFISDSMPDHWGNKVFSKWLEERHLKNKQINPVDRLAFIGNRGMGALEFQPAYLAEDSSANVDLKALYRLSDKIFHDREDFSLNMKVVLNEQDDYEKTRNYWKYLKTKLKREGNQLVSDTNQLKLTTADGKKYKSDTLDSEGVINLAKKISKQKSLSLYSMVYQ